MTNMKRKSNWHNAIKERPITEKDFQGQVIRIAKVFGWKVYHTYDSRRSEPGYPDLCLVKHKIMFRELKREKGRLTPAQKEWGEAIKKAGGDWDVWRPSMIDKIREELQE